MRTFQFAFLFSFLIFQVCASPSLAFEDAYLPLSRAVLSHRVVQASVLELMQVGQRFRTARAEAVLYEGNLLEMRGCDLGSKRWSLRADLSGRLVSVWSADLDENGQDDLIFFLKKLDQDKWRSSSQLLILTFNKAGMPEPWMVEGYFLQDSRGVKDLLDIDADGKAELLLQSIDDGYWLSSLYELNENGWRRTTKIEGLNFPLYTRFSSEPNRSAIEPPAYRHPREPDFSSGRYSSAKRLGPVYFEKCRSGTSSVFLCSEGNNMRVWNCPDPFLCVFDDACQRKIALGAAAAELLGALSTKQMAANLKYCCQSGKVVLLVITPASSRSGSNPDLALRRQGEFP